MNIFNRFLFLLVICFASNVQAMESQLKQINLAKEFKIIANEKNKVIDELGYTESITKILKRDLLLPVVIVNQEVISNILSDKQKAEFRQVMNYVHYCCEEFGKKENENYASVQKLLQATKSVEANHLLDCHVRAFNPMGNNDHYDDNDHALNIARIFQRIHVPLQPFVIVIYERLVNDLQRYEEHNAKLITDNATLQTSNDDLNRQVNDLTKNGNEKSNLIEVLGKKNSEIQQSFDEQNLHLATLNQELSRLNLDIATKVKHNAKLITENTTLQEAQRGLLYLIEEIKTDATDNNNNLLQKNDVLKLEIDVLNKENIKLQSAIETLGEKNNISNQKNINDYNKNAELTEKLYKEQAEVEIQKTRCSKLTSENEKLRAKTLQDALTIETLEFEKKQLETDIATKVEHTQQLTTNNATLQEFNNKLAEQNLELINVRDQIKYYNKILLEKNSNLQDQVLELSDILKKKDGKISEVEKLLGEKTQENTTLQKEIENLKKVCKQHFSMKALVLTGIPCFVLGGLSVMLFFCMLQQWRSAHLF